VFRSPPPPPPASLPSPPPLLLPPPPPLSGFSFSSSFYSQRAFGSRSAPRSRSVLPLCRTRAPDTGVLRRCDRAERKDDDGGVQRDAGRRDEKKSTVSERTRKRERERERESEFLGGRGGGRKEEATTTSAQRVARTVKSNIARGVAPRTSKTCRMLVSSSTSIVPIVVVVVVNHRSACVHASRRREDDEEEDSGIRRDAHLPLTRSRAGPREFGGRDPPPRATPSSPNMHLQLAEIRSLLLGREALYFRALF